MSESLVETKVVALRESEVGQRCGVSVAALRRWRREGRGPKFIRLAGTRLIRYLVSDLEAWLRQQEEEVR